MKPLKTTYLGVLNQKHGKFYPPKHPIFNRVFHDFHHPYFWKHPYLLMFFSKRSDVSWSMIIQLSPSLWCGCDPSRTRHMYTTYTASSRWCIMLFLLQNRHGDGTCSKSPWGSLHLCMFFCHDLQMVFCR